VSAKQRKVVQVLTLLLVVVFLVGVWVAEADAWGGGGKGGGGKGGGGYGGKGGGYGGKGGFGKGFGKGGRSDGMTDRSDVAKDLEERRNQEEKEARITEARQSGAETAFDEMQQGVLEKEREKVAAERRADWRKLANPG
jgi:hypothetical protein